MTAIRISIEADFGLTEREAWPDGPPAGGYTAADVLAALCPRGDRLTHRDLDDWSLLDGLQVTIRVGDTTARTVTR